MQGDFIEKEDSGVTSAYGTAWLVDENGDGFFSLVIPTESVASVYGETETFEWNSLLSRAKAQIKGKKEMTAVTQEFALTQETRERLKQLEGKTLQYMVAHSNNFIGYTYWAEISWKETDSEADILKGEVTITPSAEGFDTDDVRPYIRQTLDFAGSVPLKVSLDSKTKTKDITLSVKNTSSTNVTYTATSNSTNFTASVTEGKLTITASTSLDHTAYGMITITASSTETMKTDDGDSVLKYAPWTVKVAVDYTV